MNDDQIEVLNITQQVLRGVAMGLLAMKPEEAARVASALQAFATRSEIEPAAAAMLLDLAEGVGMVSAAGKPRQ